MAGLLVFAVLIGGCRFSLSIEDAAVATSDQRAPDQQALEGGADVLSLDQTTTDGGAPDQAALEQGAPDLATADQTFDQGTPDQTTPDQAAPDQTSPDQSTPDQTSPDQTSPDQASPDQASPDQTSPDQGGCGAGAVVSGKPALKATLFAQTSWSRLVDLQFRPGDPTRLFVLEQHNGRVRVIKSGVPQGTAAIDIGSRLSKGNEQGLLGLAFHPQHAQNRKLYLFYTDTSAAVQVREFQTQVGNPDRLDLASERTILSASQPQSNHNGGGLRFGRDGYLYISIGDGGGGGDNHGSIGNGQRKDTLLGKILRIDVDATSPGKNYAVPTDNPFVGDASYAPEIAHLGLRNPFRFSFDRQTGALWIADVGQNAWEEIDYVAPGQLGKNFGWRCREGLVSYNMSTPNCSAGTFVDPVLVKPTTGPYCSMIMGYPYRGCRMPGYQGTVFYSDYCHPNPRRFDFNGVTVSGEQAVSTINYNPIAWAEDQYGELYFVRLGNRVFRIDPN
jgi:glucose/arabinose dehydrogenase